jgi:hypothetical protein
MKYKIKQTKAIKVTVTLSINLGTKVRRSSGQKGSTGTILIS